MKWLIVLLFVASGCASAINLTNGSQITGSIRKGYESYVYVNGTYVPRSEIKSVEHPTIGIFYGAFIVIASSAVMMVAAPGQQSRAGFWDRTAAEWVMRWSFVTGMSVGSTVLYFAFDDYDDSVAAFNERRPDPKQIEAWRKY